MWEENSAYVRPKWVHDEDTLLALPSQKKQGSHSQRADCFWFLLLLGYPTETGRMWYLETSFLPSTCSYLSSQFLRKWWCYLEITYFSPEPDDTPRVTPKGPCIWWHVINPLYDTCQTITLFFFLGTFLNPLNIPPNILKITTPILKKLHQAWGLCCASTPHQQTHGVILSSQIHAPQSSTARSHPYSAFPTAISNTLRFLCTLQAFPTSACSTYVLWWWG